MGEVVFEFPIRITMKLTGGDTTYPDVGCFFVASFFAPFDTNLGSEPSDIFVILEIGPKFDLGAGFLT